MEEYAAADGAVQRIFRICAQTEICMEIALQCRLDSSQKPPGADWLRAAFFIPASGFEQRLLLVLFELLHGVDHAVAGVSGVAPALDLDPLAFQILVDREEVGDLLEHVGVDVGVVPDVGKTGIVVAYGQNLFVEYALIEHLQQADGTDFLQAAGKAGAGHHDEHVQRIAVVAQRGGDKAVIARVVHGGVQITVQLEDVQLLVVLEFIGIVFGDLDDGAKNFRRTLTDRQFQVVDHGSFDLLGDWGNADLALNCQPAFGPSAVIVPA